MKRITKFSDLKVGQTYLEISRQFNNAENLITVVSPDTLSINREICYAVFTERISKLPSPEEVKKNFEDNKFTHYLFSIWGHDVKDGDAATEFYEFDKEDHIKTIKDHFIPAECLQHLAMGHGKNKLILPHISVELESGKCEYHELDKLSMEDLVEIILWMKYLENRMTAEEKEIRTKIGQWGFHLLKSDEELIPIVKEKNEQPELFTLSRKREFLELTTTLDDGRKVFIQQDKSYQFADFLKYNIIEIPETV